MRTNNNNIPTTLSPIWDPCPYVGIESGRIHGEFDPAQQI
jgi:hypothetical protein